MRPRPVSRRSPGLAALAVAAAAAIAFGILLATRGGGDAPRRSAYLAQVSSVCRVYARRLSRIGAPSDVTAYGDVVAIVGRVVPLLREQAARMEAVDPPPSLRADLDRLFALDRRSIAALETTLAAARRRDAGGVGKGIVSFSRLSGEVHSLATSLGIRCTAN